MVAFMNFYNDFPLPHPLFSRSGNNSKIKKNPSYIGAPIYRYLIYMYVSYYISYHSYIYTSNDITYIY